MSMEQLYQELILDHAKERHGYGLIDGADGADGPFAVGESFQVNPTCGDEVRLRVRVSGEGEAAGVADVSWEGDGCSISQASLSVLTDLVTGSSLAEVAEVASRFSGLMHSRGAGLGAQAEERLGDAAAFVGVSRYPIRVKCALLGWKALEDALIRTGTFTSREGE